MNEEVKDKKCPQLRFSGFDDEWEEKKLGNVSDRVTRKNENLESTLPLTISAQYGLVDQITFFNNQVASTTNLRNYFLVKNGEFAYNKSYSAGYPWGAVKRLDRYEKGVLSTLYIVFKPKNINSDYLLSYYDTDKWYKQVSEIAAEGARNHGLLNIAPNDFFQTTFYAPKSENEQQKIGTILSKIDSLIQAKTKKLESLKTVKKSLLQKCFPKDGEKVPQMRFKGFSEDWENIKFSEFCSFYSGGTPTAGNTEYYNGDIPFIRSGEIHQDRTELFLSQSGYDSSSAKMVIAGTILYALYGANSGDVSISKITGAINQAILAIIPNENYISTFILYYLQGAKDRIVSTYLQGGQGNLSAEIVKDIIINTPSKTEQQKIGQFFSKYDSLISLQQKEIDNLKTIKKSLLQKMFV